MRTLSFATLTAAAVLLLAAPALAAPRGVYMETRTCQIYTGPCFANAETGLAGQDAIMAWAISEGEFDGVDLSGLNVVVVLRASDTLGFRGLAEGGERKSIILYDSRANAIQQAALIAFARRQSQSEGDVVVRTAAAPIEMSLDLTDLTGSLQAGDEVSIEARKARPGDCICSNESAYYPPLTELASFVPAVTIDGGFRGRGLGSRWSMPDSRSSYLGLFGDN